MTTLKDHSAASIFSAHLKEQVEDYEAILEENFLNGCALCGSEIERMFLAELMFCPFDFLEPPHEILSATEATPQRIKHTLAKWRGVIVPQYPVGSYRADFLVSLPGYTPKSPGFLVECDGHDFHEKTKEQAAKDKSRDRYLQSRGFHVFRFTGSEIYRDVEKCARELNDYGANWIFAHINNSAGETA